MNRKDHNELNRLMKKIHASTATVREYRRALELQDKVDAEKAKHHELDDAKVGDGATYTIYSDSKAGTIVKRTAKTIYWQRDKATLLNGVNSDADDKLQASVGGFAAHVSGVQRYDYERDEDAPVLKFTRREVKDLRTGEVRRIVWKRAGSSTRSPGSTLGAGRHEHYDYNF